MPDVTLVIDGQSVTVPAGTNIVDAARTAGTAIPVFCYHPKMKPVGMCRMCLVEVWTPKMDPATRQPVMDENGKPVLALMMGKLQPGCVTPVSPGMDVRTTTTKTSDAQRGVLELLLTSHPLDCPVCDKGGECPLQNLTMGWGPGKSRFDYADKVHFEKPIPLGDLIYLDRERCILCSRCVRFQDEIADDQVLGFDNRGRSWEIISKSDPAFDSKFSGNTTDICPVGALTSADFRFKARVWELKSTPHVCTNCSVGCNLSIDTKLGNLMRVMPRENDFVNEIWNCDKGRYGQRAMESGDRLTTPLIRRNGQLVEASWDEALATVAQRLSSYAPQEIGGIANPRLANEDLYLFRKLLRETLGTPNMDHRPGLVTDLPLDDVTPVVGVGSGTNLTPLGKGTSVLVIGADVEEEAPLYKLRLRGIQQRGGSLTVVSSFATRLDRSGTSVRIRPGTEAQFALGVLAALFAEQLTKDGARVRDLGGLRRAVEAQGVEGYAQQCGVSADALRAAARSFAAAENGILVYGRQALAAGESFAQAALALTLLTGHAGKANNGTIALLPGGNSRGAHDMGIRPAEGGLSAQQMLAAAGKSLKALYIAGSNPAGASPLAEEPLNGLEFLVVQDMFLTETARLADVVLPVAAWAEREGTVTNAERRVQRSRQARSAPNSVPADWVVFQDLARALQAAAPVSAPAPISAKKGARAGAAAVAAPVDTWNYAVASDIADEISQRVIGYGQASYTSLELTRASFGRTADELFYYDGTSYANNEGLGTQVATRAEDTKFAGDVRLVAPQPVSGELLLQAVTRAYDGDELLKNSKLGSRTAPPHVVLSVADAARAGVVLGDSVTISSAAGSLTVPVVVDGAMPAGAVLLPLVRGVDPAALLGGPVTVVTLTKAE